MKRLTILTLTLSFFSSSNANEQLAWGPRPLAETEIESQGDSLWGFSSEGREIIEVETNIGMVIKAVDVDGLAYSGDMILGRTQDLKMYGLQIPNGKEQVNGANFSPRQGENFGSIRYPNSGYKWPGGIVPYTLAPNLGNQARQAIQYAINEWNTKTNLQFVQRTNQQDYVWIQNGSGCNSFVGRQGGRQIVNMAEACGYTAAVHELGHAVGFFHEQSRSDRDNFVTINYNNIQPSMAYNFAITPSSEGRDEGRYDYYSIMHYPSTAFSINGGITVQPRQGGIDINRMGNGTQLTAGDIAATAAMYGNTGGGGGGGGEDDTSEVYRGNLRGSNDTQIQPDGNWFYFEGGRITATLQGPANSDFQLLMYGWQNSQWQEIARSITPGSSERIQTNVPRGYYYFSVASYFGSGTYELRISK